ncbi:MAG: hypothetical protein VX872_06345, partial [Candidatus Thermoplasmatota archaeon]|nr:hypothetical protein [Candidatus Thermoplasmatota archaeon]
MVKKTISVEGEYFLKRLARAYIRVKCPKPTPLVGKNITQSRGSPGGVERMPLLSTGTGHRPKRSMPMLNIRNKIEKG